MTFEEVTALVQAWGHNKGIIAQDSAHSLTQLTKTAEEILELAGAINRAANHQEPYGDPVKSELGDILVTLVMVSSCLEIDLVDALEFAYHKINRRTGRVVDGIFVKDAH